MQRYFVTRISADVRSVGYVAVRQGMRLQTEEGIGRVFDGLNMQLVDTGWCKALKHDRGQPKLFQTDERRVRLKSRTDDPAL